MLKARILKIFLLIMSALPLAPISAAEFDLDAQRTMLRQLQYCLDCGSALLVTRVHPGVEIRCPDCGKVQPRLADRHLIVQLYQLCRLCQMPLNAEHRHPGETVECDNCHTRQPLSRDAFLPEGMAGGLGYAPGFPPGSAKKALLHSPERPTAILTPVPLEDPTLSEPPPSTAGAIKPIPPPPPIAPATPAATSPGDPPLLEPPQSAGEAGAEAVPVPAVTVDMFGGGRREAPATREAPAAPPETGVLATVDGVPIRASEVDRVLEPLLARLRAAAGPEGEAELERGAAALRREVLERLVDRELAVREAAALGHKPDPAAIREREAHLTNTLGDRADVRREAERDVVMADMRRRFAERPASVSPGATRDYYRAHAAEFHRPRLLALAPLVVFEERAGRDDRRRCRDIAREISQLLEQGKGFEDLRRRYDEFDPEGDAPPPLLPESAYAGQILRMAGDLAKGAVFGPLFMEGMALFGKVVDERPAGPAPLREVEKEIVRRLEEEAVERAFSDWLKQLRSKARIEIFP